jgi:DNA polymerase-3 subunit delta'
MTRRPRATIVSEEEAAPEADRLEGFPHPRETATLLGHGAAEAELANALRSGRVHHAWLLAGPAGVGKATLAYRFARALLARPGEIGEGLDVRPESVAARQVLALSHPGLYVLRRQHDPKGKRFPTAISVDDVRRLKPFLSLTAGADSRRVVIVDSADELNVNAANALLKSIEEPLPGTVFLLITSEPGRLIRTIHSRCRRLDMPALREGDLAQAVAGLIAGAGKEPVQPDRMALLHGLSGGSVRRALELAAGDGLKLYERTTGLLARLPDVPGEVAIKLADDLSGASTEEAFDTFFALLGGLVARLVRQAATGDGGIGTEAALAQRLLTGPQRLASFAALWETVAREKALCDALNLDRRALLLDTIRRLEAAGRA